MNRRLNALLLGVLLTTCWGSPARGEEPVELVDQIAERAKTLPVQIEARLGIGSRSPRRGFCLVQADLRSTDATRNVVVVIRPHDEETPLLTLGPVALEAGVPRRVRGLSPARLINEAATLLFEVYEDGDLVGIGIADAVPGSPQLLVLDRRDTEPVTLSKLETRAAKKGARELAWITALVARPGDLPESALAYTGVGAVLLGSLSPETWSPAQARALAGWVSRGGHLVISLDPQAGNLRKTPLGAALGQGLAPIPANAAPIPGDRVTLSQAFRELGAPDMAQARPPTLAVLAPTPEDSVLLRDDDGRPLVVTRRVGRGRLTLVAVDLWAPPFRHASVTRTLLARILDSAARFEPRSRWLFPKLAEIRQPTQVGPAFALLLIFAMIAGPGIYFFLRAKKRGILLWIAIPALTLAFTAIVPFYRFALKDAESTLVGVRLIEARVGSEETSETIDVLLFSGSLGAKEIEIEGGDASAFAVTPPHLRHRRRGKGVPGLGQALGSAGSDGKLHFELPVALWGARYLSCERSGRRRAVTGVVTIAHGAKQDQVSVDFTYPGPQPLKEVILAVPVRDSVLYHRISGDLTMGERYQAQSIQKGQSTSTGGDKREGLAPLMLDHLMQSFVPRQALSNRKAYLIGYLESPAPLRAKPKVRTRAFATLLMIEIPLQFQGGLPFGHLRPRRNSSTIAEISSTMVQRRVVERFALPAEARREKLRRLTIRFERPRARTELVLEVRGRNGWRALDLSRAEPDEREKTSVRLDLESPADLVDQRGTVTFRQTFLRLSQAVDAGSATLIDVSLAWGEKPPEEEPEQPDKPGKTKPKAPKPRKSGN
ncbi:MAG: hypothetical protein JKY65_29580 [Planctomycetes bacterium]|nr:hypothetical protein [Planctomycetota bacterium]